MSDPIAKPAANAVAKPTADISLSAVGSGVIQNESYPIIPKNNSKDDYLRPVKMSDIFKIKNEAVKITNEKIKWDEIALGVSTLGFGASLSAFISGVVLNSGKGVLFYIISPVISFSLAVFVVMYKVMKYNTSRQSASIIVETIEPYEDFENIEDTINESK